MAPSESQGRPRRADWHPKHFHTVCLDGTHPYHALGPLLGPLLHSRAPKRARFGPERPFWGSPRVLEGPRGPDLVPTAANWSDWVGVMVTKHFGLVLGLFWVPRDTKRTRFGPKCPFLAPKGPIWGQNSKLSQTYHVTYQNLREKGTQPMEKTSSQSGLPVERKFQKNYQLGSFAEMAKMHL